MKLIKIAACALFILFSTKGISYAHTHCKSKANVRTSYPDDSMTSDKYGVPKDGSPASMQKLQEFLDYCAAHNMVAIISTGDYIITTSVYIGDNMHIRFEPGAKFIRSYKSDTGFKGSTLEQKDETKPIANVSLDDFYLTMADPADIGRPVTLYGNKMNINNMTINGYRGAMAMVIVGNDILLDKINISNSGKQTSEGGIRIEGGDNIVCTNSTVESGDDCFQFVPSANPTDPLFDMNISNCRYENCVGSSAAARLIVAEKEENSRCSIKNVSFINIKGSGGHRQMFFYDKSRDPLKTELQKEPDGYEVLANNINPRGRQIFNDGDMVDVKAGGQLIRTRITVEGGKCMLKDIMQNIPNRQVTITNTVSGVIDGIYVKNFEADCSRDSRDDSFLVRNIENLKTDNFNIKNMGGHFIKTDNYTGTFAKPNIIK